MCGGSSAERRRLPRAEVAYLDSLVRGVYAKRDLPPGHVLTDDDYYLAIPLQRGQLSCRELITGDPLVSGVCADEPITVDLFDNPYARPGFLHERIVGRGIERADAPPRHGPARVVGGIPTDVQRPITRVVDHGPSATGAPTRVDTHR